jgi:hypothetical protein
MLHLFRVNVKPFGRMLIRASTSDNFPEYVSFSGWFRHSFASGQQSTYVHWSLPMHVAYLVRQGIAFCDVRRNKLQYLVHYRTR